MAAWAKQQLLHVGSGGGGGGGARGVKAKGRWTASSHPRARARAKTPPLPKMNQGDRINGRNLSGRLSGLRRDFCFGAVLSARLRRNRDPE